VQSDSYGDDEYASGIGVKVLRGVIGGRSRLGGGERGLRII
jgi:hypothetical protein